MKDTTTNRFFRAILIAAMSLIFNTTANAQTTRQPNLPKSVAIYNGIILYWDAIVDVNDTTVFSIEASPTAAFTSPTYFPSKTRKLTKNGSFVDTIRESDGLPKAPKIINFRIKNYSGKRNDSVYSVTIVDTTLQKPGKPSIHLVSYSRKTDGCFYTINVDPGAPNAIGTLYRSSKDSVSGGNFLPEGSRKYQGVKTGIYDSIVGKWPNEVYYFKLTFTNELGVSVDTVFKLQTNDNPDAAKIIPNTYNVTDKSIYGSFKLVSFGIPTNATAQLDNNPAVNIVSNFSSSKAEPFNFSFTNLKQDSTYTITISATNAVGSDQWKFTFKTDKSTQITITGAWAISGGIEFDWNWVTSNNKMLKRVDCKAYLDANGKTPATNQELYHNFGGLTGGYRDTVSNLKPKKYWIRLTAETDSGFYYTGFHPVTVLYGLSTQTVVKLPIGPTHCKIVDLSGRIICENWIVDPKVSLFTNDLPVGVFTAIPLRSGYTSFTVYNNGK